MKEYYLDFKGNKRRLKFYHGDVIVSQAFPDEDKCNLYKVIHETHKGNYGWSLQCLVCGRPVLHGGEDKDEFKKLLLNCYDVRKVIAKHELVDLLQPHVGLKIIKD